MKLFLPTARQTNWLLVIGFASGEIPSLPANQVCSTTGK